MVKENGTCGIVLLNYFTAHLLKKLCKSFLSSSKEFKFKIYIVDNSCNEAEWSKLELISKCCDSISIHKSIKNLGYGAGNYIGVRKAFEEGCDGVIICNPDVEIPNISNFDYFITKIEHSLNKLSKPVIAAPQVFNPFTNSTENPINFPHFFHELLGLRISKSLFSFSGCFFFMNYNAVKSIDYFPRDVFMYNEELIIGKMLKEVNADYIFVEDAQVNHCHKKEFNGFYSEFKRKKNQISSRIYVYINYFEGTYLKSIFLFTSLWIKGTLTIILKILLTTKNYPIK